MDTEAESHLVGGNVVTGFMAASSLLSEDWLVPNIAKFLGLRDMVRWDSAMACHRMKWLESLLLSKISDLDRFLHTRGSIKWLIMKQIRITKLKVNCQ